jgi:phasin family protein
MFLISAGRNAMAKKPESEPESFIDMFARFGQDLRMPNFDVDRIMEHHRKNLEALEKAAEATAAGASSLLSRQREALQQGLREFSDMVENYQAPGSPQEAMAKQADFARRSFEAAVKNAGEVAEIMRKSGSESTDILRRRLREAMDEIRESYERQR